jgi:hypothetical protein
MERKTKMYVRVAMRAAGRAPARSKSEEIIAKQLTGE